MSTRRSRGVGNDKPSAILALLRSVSQETGREALAARLKEGRTVYQSDPGNPNTIERIDPSGQRTKGRFESGRFVQVSPERARQR